VPCALIAGSSAMMLPKLMVGESAMTWDETTATGAGCSRFGLGMWVPVTTTSLLTDADWFADVALAELVVVEVGVAVAVAVSALAMPGSAVSARAQSAVVASSRVRVSSWSKV
jgi:hypothetical protein